MKAKGRRVKAPRDVYGLAAEFAEPAALVEAARQAHQAGFRRLDAYSPFPVEGLAEAFGSRRTWIPPLVLLGGIGGGIIGYLMQWYLSAVDYPLNIGGRPLNSWPAFIPVTFEMTILGAALFAVFGMLALNGLPMPYHPLFNLPNFGRVTQDRFFLVIESSDSLFDRVDTRSFLVQLGAREVSEVPQ